MAALVSNLSPAPRGLLTAAGPRVLDPGETAELDLLPHPVHDAWVAAGDLRIGRAGGTSEGSAVTPPERSPPAPRRRGRTG